MPTNISLLHPYLSISALECPELPDFAVLTGRNGAGKTQLLQALAQGHAAVAEIGQPTIELYDMASFHPPNSAASDRQSRNFTRETLHKYLTGDGGPPPIEIASEIYERHADAFERQKGGCC